MSEWQAITLEFRLRRIERVIYLVAAVWLTETAYHFLRRAWEVLV